MGGMQAFALGVQHPELTRKVVSIDYRGRGLSGRDADWRRYDPRIECEDVLAQCTALGIAEAAVVGTSRGGLVAMGARRHVMKAAAQKALRGQVPV
jgi:pimeloyl-ACP methyl ester carboxylesterase